MRVPIIAVLDRNDSGSTIFPDTDSTARIRLLPPDGERITEIYADRVDCRDIEAAGTSITFWMDGIAPASWEVTVTESRILFWNPASKGLLGKPKVKPGKATGGQLAFRSILNLDAFCDRAGNPILLCICKRKDHAKTAVSVTGDREEMQKLLMALHAAIDAWSRQAGVRLTPDNDQYREILEKWERFPRQAWKDPTAETVVTPPCEAVQLVATSRMEE